MLYTIPCCRSRASRHSVPARLAVLQTSRQIYFEVSAILYNRELCFLIDQHPDTPSDVGLRIKGLPSYYSSEQSRMLHFPRFKSIRFEIKLSEKLDCSDELRRQIRFLTEQMRENIRFFADLETERSKKATKRTRINVEPSSPSLAILPPLSVVFYLKQGPNAPEIEPFHCPSLSPKTGKDRRNHQIWLVLTMFEYLGQMRRLDIKFPTEEYSEDENFPDPETRTECLSSLFTSDIALIRWLFPLEKSVPQPLIALTSILHWYRCIEL